MTMLTVREIECPECHLKQEVEIWESVNVSLDPNLKRKLFEGHINFLKCQKCAHEFPIDVPLLYHDMEKQFLVQYIPLDWIDDDSFLSQFTKQGEPSHGLKIPKKLVHGKSIHMVFSMDELIRYVLFRGRLYEKWKTAS